MAALRGRRDDAVWDAPAPGPAPAAGPIVVAEGLLKSFGAAADARQVTALAGVSIEIAAGESVGLVGESGSGKSTLGRCLVGLERPDGGRAVVDGVDLAGDRARLHRAIQMVFQDPYSTLNPVRTVGATLAEALRAHDPKLADVRDQVAELLERVGLPPAYSARKPAALSGGERQRVAIARAVAMQPRVIVCDEAVSALDVSVQAQVLNLLSALRRDTGVSYLFITHDLAVVRQVADRIYVLRRGEVVEFGPTATVLDHPSHPYTRALIDAVPRPDGTWLTSQTQPEETCTL
jgi:peptide/nickel transport system ATP-binding protein